MISVQRMAIWGMGFIAAGMFMGLMPRHAPCTTGTGDDSIGGCASLLQAMHQIGKMVLTVSKSRSVR